MAVIIVLKGDTLTKIANIVNSNLSTLLRLNPKIKNPNLIYVGQTVNVPDNNNGKALAVSRGAIYDNALKPVLNNNNGEWGVYPRAKGLPHAGEMANDAAANSSTNPTSGLLKSPFLLAGLGVLVLALLSNKRSRN